MPEIIIKAESVDGKAPEVEELVFVCEDCDRVSYTFKCRCPSCGEYNSLREKTKASVVMKPFRAGVPNWENRLVTSHNPNEMLMMPGESMDPRAAQVTPRMVEGVKQGALTKLSQISPEEMGRLLTGEEELDFVLGGGMQPPSVIMIGGDPGVGKSTILTQVYGKVGELMPAVYGCGEESQNSVALRTHRLGIINERNRENCQLLQGTDYEAFEAGIKFINAKFAVLDSLQTFRCSKDENGLPMPDHVKVGSERMTRAIADRYHKFCHNNNVVGWIVCHVTKSGDFAGPQVVMHAIDTNIMLTHTEDSRVAATSDKNRNGPTDVAGFFRMTEKGLKSS